MTEKLCKDCKWCVEPGEFAKCDAPQNRYKPLTGFKSRRRWDYCGTHRGSGGTFGFLDYIFAGLGQLCGPQGRWWTPK
jgi:hypothetical protein